MTGKQSLTTRVSGEQVPSRAKRCVQVLHYRAIVASSPKGLWRNGSASDSRSEGWEFESLWPHLSYGAQAQTEVSVFLPFFALTLAPLALWLILPNSRVRLQLSSPCPPGTADIHLARIELATFSV